MNNSETFTKDEVFDTILKRRQDLEERIKNPSKKDTSDYIFSLKVRWNEIGHILDALGYSEYEEQKTLDDDLDEIFNDLT